jgi:hypothetical protein
MIGTKMFKGIFTAAVALVASGVSAHAVCTQAQLAGTWAADAIGSSAFESIEGANCTLVIDTTGKLLAGSGCAITPAYLVATAISGSLKLTTAANCSYKGSFKIQSAHETYQVIRLTLATTHVTASAAGIYGSGNFGADSQAPFLMNLTKIK